MKRPQHALAATPSRQPRILITNLLFSAAIFLVVCFRLYALYSPTVMPDELGYWSAGSFFSGHPWTDVMPLSPYYSYGYGFLLAPLFLLQSPVAMFRGAVVLNAALLVCAYFVAQKVAHLLFAHISIYFRQLACFALSVYSYLVYNAQGTQPDVAMVLVYWLLVWCLLTFIRTPTWGRASLLALIGTFLFILHMRNLGVLIALAMVLLLLALAKKIPPKYALLFGVLLAGLLCAATILKTYYSAQTWGSSDRLDINNTSSVFSSVLGIFSAEGLLTLCMNVLGRIFYLGCSTFFLFYWAVFVMLRDLWQAVRKKNLSAFHTVEFFLLLTMLGEIGISCLFAIQPSRMDHILYGRYHEQVLMPLLLFGLFRLRSLPRVKSFLPVGLLVHFSCSAALFHYINQSSLNKSDTTPSSMAGMSGFLFPDVDNVLRYTYIAALLSAVIFLIFFLLLSFRKRHMVAWVLGILCLCWVGVGNNAATNIFYSRAEAKLAFYELASFAEENFPHNDYYYLMSDRFTEGDQIISSENIVMLGRKFFFPRTQLHLIGESDLSKLLAQKDANTIIFVEEAFVSSNGLETEFFPVYQCGSTELWAPSSVDLPTSIYEELIVRRLSGAGLTFSAAFSSLTDNEGEVAAGMILDNYQPKDDSVGEMAKAGIRYVQVTNRALAEKMIAAGIPLEEHLFLPLRYTAAELKTNGHAPNRADEPIALRNGLVQFGPYCTLGKGVYRITVEGSGFAEHTKVRVQSGVGGKDHDIVLEQASEDKVVYQLPLEGAFENLEFCMTGIDSETVKISSLTIELLDAGSEEIIPADRLPLAQLRDEDGWTPVTAAMQQQIEALTGRHMDTNTYAAARALDLAAMVLDGDAAFSDGAVALRQGGVLRGPGEALDAGTYRVTVTGDNLTRAEFSLLTGGGETKVPVQYLSSTPGKVVYLVTLGAEVPDAEYAAYSTDTAYPVTITGIQVEQAVG